LSALGMTAIRFALKKAGSLGLCLACLVMGTVLAAFNYTMAVELASKWREDIATPRAQTVAKSAALRARITGAANSRTQLAKVPPTMEAALETARRVADAASLAKDRECGHGDRNSADHSVGSARPTSGPPWQGLTPSRATVR